MDGRWICFRAAPVPLACLGVDLRCVLPSLTSGLPIEVKGQRSIEMANPLPLRCYSIGALRIPVGQGANVKAGLAGSCSIGYGDPPLLFIMTL
jgi:hypothetical protein